MKMIRMSKEVYNKLKKILTGQIELEFIKRKLLPIILIFFCGFLTISWLLYPPTSYSMLTKTISSLGNPDKSTFGGWIVWSVGMTISAFLFIPLLPFIHRKMFNGHILNKMTVIFGTFFFSCTIYGMIFLGLIPQFTEINEIYGLYHTVNAILAFGGMYLGMGVYGLSILLQMLFNKRKKDKLIIVFNIFWWIPPIGTIASELIRTRYFPGSELWYLNFPFWEWLLLIMGFIALLTMFHLATKEE